MRYSKSRFKAGFSLAVIAFLAVNTLTAAWQKTVLDTTSYLVEPTGFPRVDKFGDPLPALPANYAPSIHSAANGLHFLRLHYSQVPDPPILDDSGFPVLGNYFQLGTVSLASSAWSTSAPLTDLIEGIDAPSFVSRLDDTVSVAHWLGDILHIDTMSSPTNTRLSLPITKQSASVAIDANEGVHVLVINDTYELLHYYYAEGGVTQSKLSDGPVCQVVAVAGEGDACHFVYSTFSEDTNANEALDEGEDINGNGVLDEAPMHLIYQSVEATVPSTIELIDDDTVGKLCVFDLHFSSAHGLKLAYADPSRNEIRFAERASSTWSSGKVSTTVGIFDSVALTVASTGESAISYVSGDQRQLFLAEESGGQWEETVIAEVATGEYFTGTDIVYDTNNQLVVLTSEKESNYLNVYTTSDFPDFFSTLVRPTEIRSAFIITWPTPAEGATKQILEVSSDLSDPDSWEFVAQRTRWRDLSEVKETVVEKDGPNRFYRVIEVSDQ